MLFSRFHFFHNYINNFFFIKCVDSFFFVSSTKNFYFFFYKFIFNIAKYNYFSALGCTGLILFIKNFFYSCFQTYMVNFYVDGLYYRLKYYKKLHSMGFLIGYSSYLVYKLPICVKVKVFGSRRKFLLYSYDKCFLGNVVWDLIHLKYPDVYSGKGIKGLIFHYKKRKMLKKR